jgi:SOS-response transcriptional repressor LexA
MSRKPLPNPKLGEIHRYIAQFWAENGRSPSVREIADGTSVKSTSQVSGLLHVLADQGKIRWTAAIARSIVLVQQPEAERP